MKSILILFTFAVVFGCSAQTIVPATDSGYYYLPNNAVLIDSSEAADRLYHRAFVLIRPIEDSLRFREARQEYEDFTGFSFFNVRQDSLTDQLAGSWEIERTTDTTFFPATIDSAGVIVSGVDTGQIQIMTFQAIRVDDLPISPIYLKEQVDHSYKSFSGKWIMRRQ